MPAVSVRTLAPVTDENLGAEIRRRRIALLGDRSQSRLAREAKMHRNTIMNAEKGEVDHITAAAILATLDRLEKRAGTANPDEILNTIRLASGVEVTFRGPENDVREELERFFAQRQERGHESD